MDINAVVCSQYFATLAMFKQAVELCPEPLWDSVEDESKFWRLAYHALFYTHMYLQKSVDDFHPWEKHWQNAEELGRKPHQEGRIPKPKCWNMWLFAGSKLRITPLCWSRTPPPVSIG
jgi:hypothetical protein